MLINPENIEKVHICEQESVYFVEYIDKPKTFEQHISKFFGKFKVGFYRTTDGYYRIENIDDYLMKTGYIKVNNKICKKPHLKYFLSNSHFYEYFETIEELNEKVNILKTNFNFIDIVKL